MKARTSGFKNEIKEFGKIITNVISVYENDLLSTQDNKVLLTQDDLEIISNTNTSAIDYEIADENIFNVTLVQKGNILSIMMKELDFESDTEIKTGTIVNYKFGLYVNSDFEYLDYGDFIVYKKEYNEDTKHWVYTCYDDMLKTMVMVDNTKNIENVYISNAINYIATKFGLEVNISNELLTEYPNLLKQIPTGTFGDIELTYRDVLNQMCQAVGVSMYVNKKELLFKGLKTSIVDTIDKNYLKDTNITFKEKYGQINSLVLSRSEDNDNIYRQDTESISVNGLHEFKIKDNLILLGDNREEFIDNIFDQINGLEFYINDYESYGICYLDWLDFYNVNIDGNTYKCLMLNDEIKIKNGINEVIYTEQPKETVTDYTTASKSDKEVSFIVDKQRGSINAKVNKGEVINEINLDESGATIRANKINLQGYVTVSDLSGTGTTTINGSNITTGTIDASRVNVTNLNANNITSGTITGDTINGGTINGSNVNITNLNANNITGGTISADKVTGGTLQGSAINLGSSTYYLKMGFGTSNPEVSGINVTGTQGVNLYENDLTRARKIIASNSSLLLCSTADTVKIGNTNTFASGQPIEVVGSQVYINQYLEVTTSANFWVYKSNGTTRLRLYEYINEASSRKVKENIKPITEDFTNELYNEVKQLPLYSYDYKEEYRKDDRFNKYGFMIDDVEDSGIGKILDIEKNNETSLYSAKGLAKLDFIIIKDLINKIDKQQEEIDMLKQEINNLKERIK